MVAAAWMNGLTFSSHKMGPVQWIIKGPHNLYFYGALRPQPSPQAPINFSDINFSGCRLQGETSRYNVCMARQQRGWGIGSMKGSAHVGEALLFRGGQYMGEEEREAHYGQGAPPCPPHLTLHPAQDDNAKQATTTQKRHNTAEPLHSQILPLP